MITVKVKNLDSVKRKIEKYKRSITKNSADLVETLASRGNDKLQTKLDTAVYDGTAPRGVAPTEWEQGKNKLSIGIVGEPVTFIEFGTGTYYEDNHPLMDEFRYSRGTFGAGQGANPPWYFRDTSGRVSPNASDMSEVDEVDSSGAIIIKTYGNPANRVVYNTGKELKEELVDVAKEVFNK